MVEESVHNCMVGWDTVVDVVIQSGQQRPHLVLNHLHCALHGTITLAFANVAVLRDGGVRCNRDRLRFRSDKVVLLLVPLKLLLCQGRSGSAGFTNCFLKQTDNGGLFVRAVSEVDKSA